MAELPLNVCIISPVVGELFANVCFHKFALCGRLFQDTTKAVFNYGTGRNKGLTLKFRTLTVMYINWEIVFPYVHRIAPPSPIIRNLDEINTSTCTSEVMLTE